jgi:histidinol-phosphate phosphatase family protein
VALDRDGTVIVERFRHLAEPDEVELIPGAIEGLRELNGLGLGLVVITNQSALGRGNLDQAGLEAVHQRLRSLLASEGIQLSGIYVCPHTPEDGCFCRKPRPGLLKSAARQLGVSPANSFVIGDKASDIECGRGVGATTILVRTGYGAQVAKEGTATPDYTVNGLVEAADVIQRVMREEQRG